MRPTALIALALVFGCAGEPARSLAPGVVPTPTALVGDACLLVPDIETIVGRQLLMPPAPYAVGTDANCIWNFNDDPSESVGFGVGRPELYADDVDTYTRLRGPGQTVDGLGDVAVLWPAMGQETRLSVRTRTHAISIGVVLETGDEARVARGIAASALSHLGD